MATLTAIMLSGASKILLSPFRLVLWTLRQSSNTLLVLLSPFFLVLYYASYAFTPVFLPFQILSKLEVRAHNIWILNGGRTCG